jgi:hypothetical protein
MGSGERASFNGTAQRNGSRVARFGDGLPSGRLTLVGSLWSNIGIYPTFLHFVTIQCILYNLHA